MDKEPLGAPLGSLYSLGVYSGTRRLDQGRPRSPRGQRAPNRMVPE